MTTLRRLGLAASLLLAACGGSDNPPPAAPPPRAASGFDGDADGWTIIGDAQATSVQPDYNGVGGNPGGLISATDDVTGGTWYFKAPAKYLGDNSATYGKVLRFDLKVTPISSPFNNYDVVLKGSGLTIWRDNSPDPGTTWTTYTVPLSEATWRKGTLASNVAVTHDEFVAVLASTTELLIRGEFNSGPDTGSLDNVKFGAAP